VLVQDRLAHPGALGDVIHRGRVVTLCDEDLPRRRQQLRTPSIAR